MADLRDEDCGQNPPRRAQHAGAGADAGESGGPLSPTNPSAPGARPSTDQPTRPHHDTVPTSAVDTPIDAKSDTARGPTLEPAPKQSPPRDHSNPDPDRNQARDVPPSPAPGRRTNNPDRSRGNGAGREAPRPNEVYGALDLGTNNCRLLLARPSRRGFRVTDAFSRIIRLGEGVSRSGMLSSQAIGRTIDALKVCAVKLDRSQVTRARLVATQACRIAANAQEFLDTVRDEVGLDIEILSEEDEARLAVSGCASLIDVSVDYVLVFDIGGGSSELIWLDLSKRRTTGRTSFVDRLEAQDCMVAWTSLPVGVVTLAEHFGGTVVVPEQFDGMVDHVMKLLTPFEDKHRFKERIAQKSAHLLGTSGTITTVAGIKLDLRRYDRNRVDGCWLTLDDAHEVTERLLNQSYEERIAEPCVGRERADLVLAGCAILEALIRIWPCERMRVADRGLREGILATLMSEDGVYRTGRRRGGRRHRARG